MQIRWNGQRWRKSWRCLKESTLPKVAEWSRKIRDLAVSALSPVVVLEFAFFYPSLAILLLFLLSTLHCGALYCFVLFFSLICPDKKVFVIREEYILYNLWILTFAFSIQLKCQILTFFDKTGDNFSFALMCIYTLD